MNCVDPLNRSALTAAIENENAELMHLLLDCGIEVKVGNVNSYLSVTGDIMDFIFAGRTAACHQGGVRGSCGTVVGV